jgi:hypothetical protein
MLTPDRSLIRPDSPYVIGVDPGTIKCGWALYNLTEETVDEHGHCTWEELRDTIMWKEGVLGICVEKMIMQHGTPPNKSIIATSQNVGRLQQI